jgi:GxxExxY protein
MTDNEITYQIRGAIFDVYNALGPGLRLDILVEDRIVIELKSVEEMKPVFFKQTKTYLKLMNKRLGLLVNFGENDMREGIHRIIL